jgi:para-nitrobenzyl esterase
MPHLIRVILRAAARLLPLAVVAMTIGACSGGSSGGSVSPPPPANPPPPVSPPPPPVAADQAQTTEGVVQGSIEANGSLKVFRGVRYAAPPTGDLRFKPPQPPEAFSGVRDATQFGSVCAQPSQAGATGSEDCLFLNVWAHTGTVRPVIVFLHGGGANGAGGNSSTIDGENLALGGEVVVVTMNRRLGALGYLAIDELVAESPQQTAGNYGIQDVIAALEWLQDNIAAFNGDPNRIMLAGQSAGGGVACGVLSSPSTMGLINSAALMSPGCPSFGVLNAQVGVPTNSQFVVDEHREVVTYFGCDASGDVLGCLRGLSAEDIVLAEEQLDAGFGNIIDGVVITANADDALANSTAGDIPLIVGSTANEMSNILGQNFVADDAEYQLVLELVFDQPLADDLYALYPTASYASANDAALTLFGDLLFNCTAERLADSAQAGAPSYLYHFARGFDNGNSAGIGAFHTIDVTHLFGTFDVWGYTPDSQANDLSIAMQNAWAGLVYSPTSVPPYQASGSSAWPAYLTASKQYVEFGETPTTRATYREGRCPSLMALFPN